MMQVDSTLSIYHTIVVCGSAKSGRAFQCLKVPRTCASTFASSHLLRVNRGIRFENAVPPVHAVLLLQIQLTQASLDGPHAVVHLDRLTQLTLQIRQRLVMRAMPSASLPLPQADPEFQGPGSLPHPHQ